MDKPKRGRLTKFKKVAKKLANKEAVDDKDTGDADFLARLNEPISPVVFDPDDPPDDD